MKTLINIILCVLFLSLSSSGCGECSTQKEPEFGLEITKGNADAYPLISRIRVTNSSKLVPKNKDGVYLMPLDLTRDKTQFVFEFNNGQEYILTFKYTRKPKFGSETCGFVMELNDIQKVGAESDVNIDDAWASVYSTGFLHSSYNPQMRVRIL